MNKRTTPELGSMWLHVKTGNIYRVMGRCIIEKDMIPAILYKRALTGPDDWWCRPITEFLDGRFVPHTVTVANNQKDTPHDDPTPQET